MAQHPTKAMISAYRAPDAAYSKTHGRGCCTYRHGPWECTFVCELCSKHAHEPSVVDRGRKPSGLLLSGACVTLDMRAIDGVSFASSDFKLRIRAQLFLPRMGYFCQPKTHNIRIKFQMSPNCHFDSLNLVRNSSLEFEFMHKIRATERA